MFSYDDYREIIRLLKESGRACTYEEALGRDSFVIMRHDVEYSVERAYELAKVEESMDFQQFFKEHFFKKFRALFNKQPKYLLDIKYYPEYLSFNEFDSKKEQILSSILLDFSCRKYLPRI